MALTTLDGQTALVVIDLQKGIVALPTAHPMDAILERAGILAEAFRARGLPVVLVNVTGGAPGRTQQKQSRTEFPADFADLVPRLNRGASDHLVTKRTWGAFTDTDLETYLRSSGVTQVVLVGVATSVGVESTARNAFELGFNVALVADAMTDPHADAHANSFNRIFPKLGEIGTTAEIIELLDSRA